MTSLPLRISVLVATPALAVGLLTACSSSDNTAPPPAGDCASPGATSTPSAVTDNGVTVSGPLGAKPTITVDTKVAAPSTLVTKDIVVGCGTEAGQAATVTTHYTGYVYNTGQPFQSSYDTGQPATFPLDGVIPGWQEGIPGMKVGGRRLLIIPPDMAYGANPPQGSGIPPNSTLVFVVDLNRVDSPSPQTN